MKIHKNIWFSLFSIVFLLSRLINITNLPVFADESIYIRWAQMIVHDPQQYLFLPLYDGKSPLFIWLLIPLLNLNPLDPLWVARFLSVIAGAITLYLLVKITREVGGSPKAAWLTALAYLCLPFTLFHDRMGLIDGLLTTFLTASFLCLLKWRNHHYHFSWVVMAGVFWGLALLTKTSALYYSAVPWGLLVYDKFYLKRSTLFKPALFLVIGGGIGLSFLLLLRISPLFPFLFKRSSDFAFTYKEITTQLPSILMLNGYRIGKWLLTYLTPSIGVLLGVGLLLRKKLRLPATIHQNIWLLLLSLSLFLSPFLISGRLLSSRYFLPVVIWCIPLIGISLDAISRYKKSLFIAFISLFLVYCVRFAYPLYTNPGSVPFANEDIVQYLTEWSSGYGIPEVRDYLISRASETRVVVATEGFFGTLPDGLLMYFDRSPLIMNLEIYGIGQPILGLPTTLIQQAQDNETYLVVNQHRFFMNPLDSNIELVASYPRPHDGPALLLYRIKP